MRAVYDIGPKRLITIHGRDRIPDGVTDEAISVISEVKNTATLSYTRQLKDYRDIAQATGRQFHLYVRSTMKLSAPLQEAIDNKEIILRYIP